MFSPGQSTCSTSTIDRSWNYCADNSNDSNYPSTSSEATTATNMTREPQVTRVITDPAVTDTQVPPQTPMYSPQPPIHTPQPQVQTPPTHPPQPQRTKRVKPPTAREKMLNQIQKMQKDLRLRFF